MHAELRTQDSRGGPDDKDKDGEERASEHSDREEQEEGAKEEQVLQWRGPGQCAPRQPQNSTLVLLQTQFIFALVDDLLIDRLCRDQNVTSFKNYQSNGRYMNSDLKSI